MTDDVVTWSTWLLSGGAVDAGAEVRDGLTGFLTSGGTESLVLAVLTAKLQGQERGVERGNVVLPTSAHAAFAKACQYFDLEERRVDVGADCRADPDAMANAGDDDTVLLVASAPQYPQGVIDPVADIAVHRRRATASTATSTPAWAASRSRSWSGRGCSAPRRRPGTSGCPGSPPSPPTCTSTATCPRASRCWRTATSASRDRQVFITDGWLGGLYASSGILGTKPGGPVGAGWAVMQYLGVEGFTEKVRLAVAARERLAAGVEAIEGLRVVGSPETTLVAFGSDPASPRRSTRSRSSWPCGTATGTSTARARRIRCTPRCTPIQGMDDCRIIEELLADLREVAAEVAGRVEADRTANYATTE